VEDVAHASAPPLRVFARLTQKEQRRQLRVAVGEIESAVVVGQPSKIAAPSAEKGPRLVKQIRPRSKLACSRDLSDERQARLGRLAGPLRAIERLSVDALGLVLAWGKAS
jgi:hypothetical protein